MSTKELYAAPKKAKCNSRIMEALTAGISVENLASRNSAYCFGSGSLIRNITEEYNEDHSNINFFSRALLSMVSDARFSSNVSPLRRSVLGLNKYSSTGRDPALLDKETDEEQLLESFPEHVTCLMNEDNYWGCFYIFPELYEDEFSPVVRIREVQDVAELVGGVLTKDMVTACLTYLKCNPILGDFVYIKLDLAAKHLQNIDVLMNYKFLVYLDLSSNLLTNLNVLSRLPYLQFLNVAFNSLSVVLDYDTPQWFLTEVHYRYNLIKKIRDLSEFWSLAVLDLSHNNIKSISGLENLRYLRRLDLSFNHIQTLENLSHLRLLWLDVSYNNISSCEFSPTAGLWTLLHLEYLNLNENNLTSMKMLSYCTRLRELHLRNNRLAVMLEVPVYMRQLRRLVILDLRANPICSEPAYKTIIISTFMNLLNLDAEQLDPVEQRTLIMDTKPDITMHTTRRLLRLIYIEQLSKARVSPYAPPADTTDVPIVVLVGHEGVGKGTLSRRLATECSSNIQLALQHTTATHHYLNHYKEITRAKFDEMLLAGEFLTYSEMGGESYGLSREEAFITEGKVKLVCLDLPAALMLKLRGYRPYLILVTRLDIESLKDIQEQRLMYRVIYNRKVKRRSIEAPIERSMLQVMLSGRIIITGIINEIILSLPEEKEKSEFMIESECSIMLDSDARQMEPPSDFNIIAFLNASSSLLDVALKTEDNEERSLYSLFKESQIVTEYPSVIRNPPERTYKEKQSSTCSNRTSESHFRNKPSSAMYAPQDGSKSSNTKSVTFTPQDSTAGDGPQDTMTGMIIDSEKVQKEEPQVRSISTKMPWALSGWKTRLGSHVTMDSDLWLAFLTEAGYLQASESNTKQPSEANYTFRYAKGDDDMMRQIYSTQFLSDPPTMGLRDPYEQIHRQCPGLFWSTVTMDDPEEAFINVRTIIRNIVKSQNTLKPMFDIDFAHLRHYPTVEKKLNKIRMQIAPQQLFH